MFAKRLWVVAALLLVYGWVDAAPVGTAFSYQGDLKVQGVPANGQFDFEFALFGAPSDGVALAEVDLAGINVANGLFSVQLDYTDAPFIAAEAYFLEVRVRNPSTSTTYTILLPRQPITPTPYAINALSIQPAGVTQSAIAGGAVGTSQLQTSAVGSNQLADQSVTTAKIADANVTPAKLSFTPGTVSSIVAGNGLTGGGTGPAVTLNVSAGTGITVAGSKVALDIAYTDVLYRGKTCQTGFVGAHTLCVEVQDAQSLTFTGCSNRCVNENAHMCRSSEMRAIVASALPLADNTLLDWIDNQDAVGSALYVAALPTGDLTEASRATSTSSYCRCCAVLE
jgi:hypothetical protein